MRKQFLTDTYDAEGSVSSTVTVTDEYGNVLHFQPIVRENQFLPQTEVAVGRASLETIRECADEHIDDLIDLTDEPADLNPDMEPLPIGNSVPAPEGHSVPPPRRTVTYDQHPAFDDVSRAMHMLLTGEEQQGLGDGTNTSPFEPFVNSFLKMFSGEADLDDPEMQKDVDDTITAINNEGYTLLGAFRYVVKNWDACKGMPLWRHVADLVAIAIVTGFLPEERSEVHLKSITIFRATALHKFDSVYSMTEGIISALNYFVEAVVASWECGSLLPFMFERTMNARLDQFYYELSDIMPKVRSGEFARNGQSVAPLYGLLQKALDAYKVARDASKPGSFEKKIFADRYLRLSEWHIELLTMKRSGSMVEQPPAIVFHGKPGCGKSLLMTATQKMICAMKKLQYDPINTANILPDDAYHSQVHNYTLFLVLDDIANRPLKYDPSMAVAPVLQACNNVQFAAVKAEVELKGKVMPDLLAVICSTNIRHMNIEQISQYSASIRRRMILIDVEVKPPYANEMGGVDIDPAGSEPEECVFAGCKFQRIQTFTINKPDDKGWHPWDYRLADGSIKSLKNLEIDEFFDFLNRILADWYEGQRKMLQKHKDLKFIAPCSKCSCYTCECAPVDEVVVDDDESVYTEITLCPNCSQQECACEEKQGLATWITATVTDAVVSETKKGISRRMGDLPLFGNLRFLNEWIPHETLVRGLTAHLIDFVNTAHWTQWWFWIPDDWWSSQFCRKLAPIIQDVALRKRIETQTSLWKNSGILAVLFGILSFFPLPNRWIVQLFFFLSVALNIRCNYEIFRLRMSAYALLSKQRNLVHKVAAKNRESMAPWLKIVLLAIPAGAGLFLLFKFLTGEDENPQIRTDVKPQLLQGNFDASTSEEERPYINCEQKQSLMATSETALIERNEKLDVWKTMIVEKQMRNFDNRSMTFEQLAKKVKKNLSTMERWVIPTGKTEPEWVFDSNIFFLNSGLFVCAGHCVPKEDIEKWRIRDNEHATSSQVVTLSKCDFLACDGGDLAYGIMNCRDKQNLIQYIEPNPVGLKGRFVCKKIREKFKEVNAECVGYHDTNREGHKVITWKREEDAERGECGGVYIASNPSPSISGIHYAALVSCKWMARSFCPSQDDVRKALVYFQSKKTMIFSANLPEDMNRVSNGAPLIIPDETIGETHIAEQAMWCRENLLEEDPEYGDQQKATSDLAEEKQGVTAIGVRSSSAFYKSRACETLIADAVRENFPGIPVYGKPKFGRSMWPKSAMYSFFPSPGLPRHHLEWAFDDYMTAYQTLSPYLKQHLRPLTWDETLNGVDGIRFLDSLNFSTSAGINFPGGKKPYFDEYVCDKGYIRKTMKDVIWEDVNQALAALQRGERPLWLYNATPKDEPTNKSKVRLFMVAQIALILIIRRYFTPVCRVLQMTTGLSECAVGMNVLSMDWEEVQVHLSKFSSLFDGDHAKFDTRKAAQISTASYSIMIHIAALGDYTADDLFVMSMCISSLTRPLVNYNGNVVLLNGSTPSGIPVTVIVNGLDNSLMNRCAFFNEYPNSPPGDFRRFVAHVNYGDDFINAVSWWRRRFNFLAVQAYLKEYGMEITPGIKDAQGTEFVKDLDSLVFLKRKSVKLENVPHRVGALELGSIYKMLTCVLSSKQLTPQEQVGYNTDTALRELAIHGKSVYDDHREKLEVILQDAGLLHQSRLIGFTHAQMISKIFESERAEQA